MDQVRKALGWLKQHHFWVLCVLVTVIGLFCWLKAAGTLRKQYDDSQNKIVAEFKNLETVRNSAFHANEEINKRQVEETSKLSAEVAELWQKLYDAQREKVLVWPPELNAAFRDKVEQLEFGQPIPPKLRETYQNYIDRHFPTLPEKIGARPIDESAAGSLGGGGFLRLGARSMPEEMSPSLSPDGTLESDDNYICVWDPANQAEVRADLDFPQQPSAIRIWVTQENLWVYHALLDVIKNTNDAAGATRMSNAAVRTVYRLEVGRHAAPYSRTPNRILKLQAATAESMDGLMPGEELGRGEGSEEMAGEFPGGRGEFAPGGSPDGSGQMTEEQEAAMLLSGRYLGEDGKPVSGAVASADPSVAADPAAPAAPIDLSAYGKEYKRLPVRMVLQMDQRHLPRLISECANQSLQIEVQEVRINPLGDIGGDGGGMASGMPGMAGGMRGSFSEFGGTGGSSLFPTSTELQAFNPQPQIATVVIQGVIYIFKKPDPAVLQTTPTEEDTSLAGAP
ncbi:MAG: hypothetical protein L0228_06980 [Planctomycetes bacterium]|nr:hypothetical protein [Planctomycetota bacterium]